MKDEIQIDLEKPVMNLTARELLSLLRQVPRRISVERITLDGKPIIRDGWSEADLQAAEFSTSQTPPQ